MMNKTLLTLSFTTLLCLFNSCVSKDDDPIGTNPFDTISVSNNKIRDKVVIISDLHLGNDITYSENVKHLARLQEFLTNVKKSSTIKELVLGGDIFDEWYVPSRTNTYNNGTQADFIRKTVVTNSGVFKALNDIISEGKIKLTYVPGNHDMGFTAENVNIGLPGVNQARDSGNKWGVGTYSPIDYPQIAIEHGHRYDFFANITPGGADNDASNTILPPGYFFARIAANSFTNPTTPEESTKVSYVSLTNKNDASQVSKSIYDSLWVKVLTGVIYVDDNFSEPIINTGIGNFTKSYSINDILPYNDKDGSIKMKLYDNLFTQAAWEERLVYNNVPVMTNIDEAINGSLDTRFIDKQSAVQYFNNDRSPCRIVIFGHTHKPDLWTFDNDRGEKCIYANSGTWEDKKMRDKSQQLDQDNINMNYIVVSPIKGDKKHLQVALYQYEYGNPILKKSADVNL